MVVRVLAGLNLRKWRFASGRTRPTCTGAAISLGCPFKKACGAFVKVQHPPKLACT